MESPSVNNENELLSKLLETSDQTAFSELYRIYFEKLSRYVFSLSGNQFQSEEIAQETLLTLWNKRSQIKINTSLNAYLYRSAYNKYLTLYDKNKKRLKLLEDLRLEVILKIQGEKDEYVEERIVALKKIIDDLPKAQKEVFILNKLQNYTFKEIAEMRSISDRTVENHIRKALITLRAEAEKLNLPLVILTFLLEDFF